MLFSCIWIADGIRMHHLFVWTNLSSCISWLKRAKNKRIMRVFHNTREYVESACAMIGQLSFMYVSLSKHTPNIHLILSNCTCKLHGEKKRFQIKSKHNPNRWYMFKSIRLVFWTPSSNSNKKKKRECVHRLWALYTYHRRSLYFYSLRLFFFLLFFSFLRIALATRKKNSLVGKTHDEKKNHRIRSTAKCKCCTYLVAFPKTVVHNESCARCDAPAWQFKCSVWQISFHCVHSHQTDTYNLLS